MGVKGETWTDSFCNEVLKLLQCFVCLLSPIFLDFFFNYYTLLVYIHSVYTDRSLRCQLSSQRLHVLCRGHQEQLHGSAVARTSPEARVREAGH